MIIRNQNTLAGNVIEVSYHHDCQCSRLRQLIWQTTSYSFHLDRLSWRLGRCLGQSASLRPPGCPELP